MQYFEQLTKGTVSTHGGYCEYSVQYFEQLAKAAIDQLDVELSVRIYRQVSSCAVRARLCVRACVPVRVSACAPRQQWIGIGLTACLALGLPQIGDAGMVMALTKLQNVEDKALLSGHLALLFGEYIQVPAARQHGVLEQRLCSHRQTLQRLKHSRGLLGRTFQRCTVPTMPPARPR